MNKGIMGYSIGYVGQGVTYNFISTYFVLFMTNCVKTGSTVASTIMSLALLIEVIAGMIVGNMSDNCTSKMGKRRPFILFSAITLPIVVFFLFRYTEMSASMQFVYYLVFSIFFRISFSAFEIPNGAFGAEIAKGYDERTRLRTVSRIFGIIGNGIAYIIPLWILELMKDDENSAWSVIGLIVAVVCFVSWMMTLYLTKGYSVVLAEKSEKKKENVLKNIAVNYVQLLKLKPMQLLIVYKASFATSYALYNIATIYYFKYCLNIGNTNTSYVYACTVAVFLISTPFINKIAVRVGKSTQQKQIMIASAFVGFIVYFFAPDSIIGVIIYIAVLAVMQNSFWQMSYSIFYDIVEVDEFVNNQRREGDIVSIISVLGTLVTSLIVQLFGIFFDKTGYNPELQVQPEAVSEFLQTAYILIPAICFAVGAIALHKFPINKKTFESLTKAVKLKKAGEDYSAYQKDIDRILTLKKN